MKLTMTEDRVVATVSGKEMTRLPLSQMPVVLQLRRVLTASLAGDWDGLKNEFGITPSGTSEAWQFVVDLTDKSEVIPVKTFLVIGSKFVDRIEIARKNGDRETIVFDGQATRPVDEVGSPGEPRTSE